MKYSGMQDTADTQAVFARPNNCHLILTTKKVIQTTPDATAHTI